MKADVTLRAECLMPERLIGRALSMGARFSLLRRPDARTLIVRCDAASADILLSICERFSIPARVLSHRGTSALLRFIRHRWTLSFALAVCAVMCWLFLTRVWFVDIRFSGENAAAGDFQVLSAALDAAGIRPGISRSLDADRLAQSLRANVGNYSYVGARLQGVRLLIEAAPESPAPGLYDLEAARDLVSDRDGVVISAVARSGELCVKPGDTVRRGQLLIRGEELADGESTRPIAALGEVVVRAWYEGEATLSLYERRAEYTGRAAVASNLRAFGFSRPIARADGFEFQRMDAEYLAVGGLYLPIGIERLTFREVRYTSVKANEAQLRTRLASLALSDAALRLSREGPKDFEIARAWIDYHTGDRVMRAHAVYEIHTNAAVTRQSLDP